MNLRSVRCDVKNPIAIEVIIRKGWKLGIGLLAVRDEFIFEDLFENISKLSSSSLSLSDISY